MRRRARGTDPGIDRPIAPGGAGLGELGGAGDAARIDVSTHAKP